MGIIRSKNSKIILIITLVFCLALAVYLFFIRTNLINNDDWKKSSRFINISLSKDIRLIESEDNHTKGFMGDGKYFAVFQFTEKQYNEFISKLKKNSKWTDLPLEGDLRKFVFGFEEDDGSGIIRQPTRELIILKNIKSGKYFFDDLYKESFLSRSEIIKADKAKNKFFTPNFVFAVLDSDSKKLYIYNIDS